MTSPSQPLNIKRGGPADSESQPTSYTPSLGTPHLRAIRAQFSGIPPNIPLRGSVTPSLRPASSNVSLHTPPDRSAPRATPQLISGLSATRQPIADLDDLPAEEKAKVLERHLVPKEQRMKAIVEGKSGSGLDGVDPGSGSPFTISRRSSNGISQHQKDDLEPFPIPYDIPGADVT